VLRADSFTLRVTARNVGGEVLPMGIGWHPYFNVPSGRRQQARLHLPARSRTLVNDYDEVLPTGEVVPVAGTPYDFSAPGGRAAGDLYLDDCFVDLETSAGEVAAEVTDPAASYGLRVVAASPPVRAIQVYAPPDKAFIVVEPQFNRADPFGPEWGEGAETGMALLEPGESVVYSARLELFTP
jgi:galactose mutarotase-like enzyme